MGYQITARSADVIEDAVAWMAAQPDLAPDGRIGLIGISFAGGLSIVAAGRPAIRDKVAYVVSFGGHGDLGRVLHYLATGEAVQAPGVATIPPHDYGVAVILYAAADRVVPPEQVLRLRAGIGTFLLASQLTLVDMKQANATFAKAREMVKQLPEPSRDLSEVRERRAMCKALGPILVPHLAAAGTIRQRRPSAPRLHRRRRSSCCTATRTRSSRQQNRSCSATTCAPKGWTRECCSARSSRMRSSIGRAAAAESVEVVAFWADILNDARQLLRRSSRQNVDFAS